MKKINLFVFICTSLLIFINASVWEGAATVAAGSELPDTGLYIATNSFPVNTAVDVTNLDNGITTRVITLTALDNPGILALLSKDAGNALGIPGRSLGRIRMTQAPDQAGSANQAGSVNPAGAANQPGTTNTADSANTANLVNPNALSGSRVSSSDPDFNPAVLAAENGYNTLSSGSGQNGQNNDVIIDLAENLPPPAADNKTVNDSAQDTTTALAANPLAPEASVLPLVQTVPTQSTPQETSQPVPQTIPAGELSLVPASERPPETGSIPNPSDFVSATGTKPAQTNPPPQSSSNSAPVTTIDPSLLIDPVDTPKDNTVTTKSEPLLLTKEGMEQLLSELPAEENMVQPPSYPNQIFSAPLVNNLEKGRYYLQIAAYSKEDTVRSELVKIDSKLPVTIMNAGDDGKPLYRILIGPVNLGESGALLQRFKGTYKDAFVRLGN